MSWGFFKPTRNLHHSSMFRSDSIILSRVLPIGFVCDSRLGRVAYTKASQVRKASFVSETQRPWVAALAAACLLLSGAIVRTMTRDTMADGICLATDPSANAPAFLLIFPADTKALPPPGYSSGLYYSRRVIPLLWPVTRRLFTRRGDLGSKPIHILGRRTSLIIPVSPVRRWADKTTRAHCVIFVLRTWKEFHWWIWRKKMGNLSWEIFVNIKPQTFCTLTLFKWHLNVFYFHSKNISIIISVLPESDENIQD